MATDHLTNDGVWEPAPTGNRAGRYPLVPLPA